MMSTMRSAARLRGSLSGLGNQLSLPVAVRPGSLTLQRCHDISSSSCCVSIIFSRELHSSETPTDPESKLPLYDAKKGHLVYTGNMTKLVKGVKTFSLSTSLIALGAQPLIIASAKDDLMFKAGLLGSFSMIMFATPLMVHYVTKKYITDIYFNEETKKFTLASRSLFLKRREVEYIADDVTLPFVGGAFTTHIIKGKEYFLQISDFRNKEVYMHMVGYDKPFEYEIKDPNANMKPKKKRKFGLFDEEDAAREKESLQGKRTQIRREAVEQLQEEKQQQMKSGSN